MLAGSHSRIAAWWGWVLRIVWAIIGSAHPPEKSAPGFKVQAYMACVIEVNFESSVLLCSQSDRRNVCRNAWETVLL